MRETAAYTIKDYYQPYIQSIEAGTVYDIEYHIYRRILVEYFKHLRCLVLDEGQDVKLPYRLGNVFIFKRKQTNYGSVSDTNRSGLLIDFHATKIYGKTMFHTNEHTNGYKYRYRWDRHLVNIPNANKYQMVMTRANKRSLAQTLRLGIRDYIELS
jgi:hypothetical protein